MNYQGVILDFNGTMFFDSSYHDLAWRQIAKELRGYEVSDEEITHHIHGKTNKQIIQYIMDGKISDEENARVSIHKEELYRHICLSQAKKPALANGVEAFLDTLVENSIPFTIASASILDNINFYLEIFQLNRWFNPSLIVYDDGSHHDKVTMFQESAQKLCVPIEECLIFEDSNSGIRFAHEAGAKDIIAIDSIRQPERYKEFPYIKSIWNDFDCFSMDILK